MGDLAPRVILIAVVVLGAAGVGYLTRKRISYHAPLQIPAGLFEPGLVVFTSTSCGRCEEALAVAKATGAPLREVTYEVEEGLQEKLGVTGVPLTVVVANDGRAVRQFAGVIGERRLRRALDSAVG